MSAAKSRQWHKALKAVRADITQYTIWHRTNTRPLMLKPMPAEFDILAIDIDALDSHVTDLFAIYWQLGRLEELPIVLERLRSNIDDTRWQRKITYNQAIVKYHSGDNAAARCELDKLGKIKISEPDEKILQLHVDLNASAMPLPERMRFYDKVIRRVATDADKIRYRTLRAIQLLKVADQVSAATEFNAALDFARRLEAKNPLNSAGELWMARLLEFAGVACRNRMLFIEAAKRIKSLLKIENEWSEAGLANLYRCLGDVLRYAEQWEDAAEAYAAGNALEPDGVQLIFRAECLSRGGNAHAGLRVLEAIETSPFEEEERLDFAISYTITAILLRDPQALANAKTLLGETSPRDPYFEKQKLLHLLAVEKALTAIATGAPKAKTGRLLAWLSRASRYLLIQPNFAGLGVNVNAMIDDRVAAKRDKDASS